METNEMTLEQFKELFPLKLMITQEIIEEAIKYNPSECIGAKTLKSIFPKQFVSWARIDGHVEFERQMFAITTAENKDLMEITKPQEITFNLKSR